MKIQSPDIPHKSEVGGVRVNIATKGEAFMAYRELLESAQSTGPTRRSRACWSARWPERASRSSSARLLDATFGPMIMVGLGGITTELFRDVIYRPAPVSAAEASAMLAELKAAPLLNGFRGAAKADVAGAVAIDRAGLGAGGAACEGDFGDRAQPGAGAPEGQGVTIVDALVVGKSVASSVVPGKAWTRIVGWTKAPALPMLSPIETVHASRLAAQTARRERAITAP